MSDRSNLIKTMRPYGIFILVLGALAILLNYQTIFNRGNGKPGAEVNLTKQEEKIRNLNDTLEMMKRIINDLETRYQEQPTIKAITECDTVMK